MRKSGSKCTAKDKRQSKHKPLILWCVVHGGGLHNSVDCKTR